MSGQPQLPGLRVAVLAAFPHPLPQGSQVYVGEQALALARAGLDVTLLCYGHGAPDDAHGRASLAALARAGVRRETPHAGLTRTPLGAGPSWRKPVADAALLGALLASQRRRRFDAILAHNVEAAAVALAARAVQGTPVVYVAHTLLGEELPSYFPPPLARAAARLGRRLDAMVAHRADAVIALSSEAEVRLRGLGGAVTRIAPALDAAPAPPPEAVAAACARARVHVGRFALYAGNLDAYQDLALLAAAARGTPETPVVVLTHDRMRAAPPGLRVVRASDAAEARALHFGAGVAVVPRRIVGGFPIKLLNYMEASRAIVAFERVADGFTHGTDAWLLPREAGAETLGRSLGALLTDPTRTRWLGANARRLLETRFGWAEAVARTRTVLSGIAASHPAREPLEGRLGDSG